MYFIVITILQTVRAISYSNGVPSMLPGLLVVVFLSMIKDAYEDYKRHVKDDEENNSSCEVLIDGVFITKSWHSVKVGQIIKVSDQQ